MDSYSDYTPVLSRDEDEKERLRQAASPYPPVDAPALTPTPAPRELASSAPPVTGTDDFSGTLKAQPVGTPLETGQPKPRPTWKDYAPPEPHGWSKFGHALAAINPTTDYIFNKLPERRAERSYDTASKEFESGVSDQFKQAQTTEQQAKAKQEEAKAKQLENPQPTPKEEQWTLTPDGKAEIEKNSGQIRPVEGDHGKSAPVKPAHVTYDSGIPVSVVAPNGDVYDVNDPKLPPELKPLVDAANRAHGTHLKEQTDSQARVAAAGQERRSAMEQVQVEREARAAVHKAEQDYNSAQSTVAMQRQLIKDAKGGNKEAVKIVPLEGALEITTSQGVHRINRTEVEQYGNAGSIFDKIKAKVGHTFTGQDIPDDVLNDMDAMTKELAKNARQRYEREYKYNHDVVQGYGGKDFDKRVPMVPGNENDTEQETKTYQGHEYVKQKDGSWKLKG